MLFTCTYLWPLEHARRVRSRDLSSIVCRQTARQASSTNNLTVTVPSVYLEGGFTYEVTLRVTSVFGGSAETSVNVLKSLQAVPAVKVSNICISGFTTTDRVCV